MISRTISALSVKHDNIRLEGSEELELPVALKALTPHGLPVMM